MSSAKQLRSEVWGDPRNGYLESLRGIQLYRCKIDRWQIDSPILSSCDLRSAGTTPQVCQFLFTSKLHWQILPTTIRGVKYLGFGQLGPMWGKKLGNLSPIRGVDGMAPIPTYPLSEVSSFDCILLFCD